MKRSLEQEIIDAPDFPESEMARVHRDLERVHRLLGTFRTLERFIRADAKPVRRVLDVGCGDGAFLRWLRGRMDVEVIGADSRPWNSDDVRITHADATRDLLPEADVAVSTMMAHHLSPEENLALIRNVGRSVRRFVILDIVRHPLPLCMFSLFIAPQIGSVAAKDGRLSIRRAYTPREFRELTSTALLGSGATFGIDVSPWLSRQVIDIRYRE